MSRSILFVVLAACASGAVIADEPALDRPGWVYLDNGEVRIGIDTRSGGAIGHFAPSGSKNLLNHFDRGRFIQQSYYGKPDGTKWADKPWRWNPVQGGDYKGGRATLLELTSDNTSLHAKSVARHWSGCVDLPEVVFDEHIELTGKVAHVRFRMTHTGDVEHPAAHQEIPAVFVEPEYHTLVLYDGDRPWTDGELSRTKPSWPNESRECTERWAAYVNDEGVGIGVYVPASEELTCYRFAAGETTARGACSYFAPLTTFAITPGKVFEYDAYLTCGTIDEIREAFRRLHEQREAEQKR